MSMTKMDIAHDTAWDNVKLDGTNQSTAEAVSAGATAIDLLQYLMDNCSLELLEGGLYGEEWHPRQLIEIRNLLEEWN